MKRLYMQVKGEAGPPHAADPDQEPVLLWRGLGSPVTGPAMYQGGPGDPLPDNTLTVVEELPSGVFQTRIWRLP
jgi:hypothetical protein